MLKPSLKPLEHLGLSPAQLTYLYGITQSSPQQSSPSLFLAAQALFIGQQAQFSAPQSSSGFRGCDCGHN